MSAWCAVQITMDGRALRHGLQGATVYPSVCLSISDPGACYLHCVYCGAYGGILLTAAFSARRTRIHISRARSALSSARAHSRIVLPYHYRKYPALPHTRGVNLQVNQEPPTVDCDTLPSPALHLRGVWLALARSLARRIPAATHTRASAALYFLCRDERLACGLRLSCVAADYLTTLRALGKRRRESCIPYELRCRLSRGIAHRFGASHTTSCHVRSLLPKRAFAPGLERREGGVFWLRPCDGDISRVSRLGD